MAQEVKTERCPQCGTEDGLVDYGQHPVYAAEGQEALDMQVEVLVCRNCGHVQVQQVTGPPL